VAIAELDIVRMAMTAHITAGLKHLYVMLMLQMVRNDVAGYA